MLTVRRPPTTRRAFGSPYEWVPSIRLFYESYVIPNASCPVCGGAVFFYQSAEGGRVFLMNLGRPGRSTPVPITVAFQEELQAK